MKLLSSSTYHSMDKKNPLAVWYSHLSTRTVDLVGDFAGSNLLVIEGDSLLLTSFSDSKLDLDEGFQLLHAVYLVERYLQRLLERRCVLKIVFFDDHQHLAIPAHAPTCRHQAYLLAREVVIGHLTKNTQIETTRFSGLPDPRFQRYLADNDVYCFLCHDGAAETPGEHPHALSFIALISRLICMRYNVALCHELDWKDTKIMIPVIESGRRAQAALRLLDSDVNTDVACLSHGSVEAEQTTDLVDPSCSTTKSASQYVNAGEPTAKLPPSTALRVRLSCTALRNMRIGPQWESAAKAYLLHVLVLEELSWRCRRLPSGWDMLAVETRSQLEGFLSTVCAHLATAIKAIDQETPRNIEEGGQSTQKDCRQVSDDAPEFRASRQETQASGLDIQPNGLHIQASGQDILRRDQGAQKDKQQIQAGDQDVQASAQGIQESGQDLADLLDGRVLMRCFLDFAAVLADLSDPSRSMFEECCANVGLKPRSEEGFQAAAALPNGAAKKAVPVEASTTILSFSHPVFDKHLSSVRLEIDDQKAAESFTVRHVFRDLAHWHNARKAISNRKERIEDPRELRRNQKRMADMMAYSASLTNAAGKILEPTSVTVGPRPILQLSGTSASKTNKGKQGKNTKKELMMQQIATDKAAKNATVDKKVLDTWKSQRAQIEAAEADSEMRYLATRGYLNDLSSEKHRLLSNEIGLYQAQTLLVRWKAACRANEEAQGLHLLAIVTSLLLQVSSSQLTTKAEAARAASIAKSLGFPLAFAARNQDGRSLTHEWSPPQEMKALTIPWTEFQLRYYGPYMSRNMDSRPDDRVPFEPDGWQRAVLDEVDADNSVFVVAPTSSGKTFISFYAMEQVLRRDDSSVLVYLAPTKALVNQIAAEIQARFSKKYPRTARSTWAIHTRDYRVNDPVSCQILVTVPHILQIMLLAPENARSWSTRVKRIIFDEVHCIGQADDGLVWEQLLLLSPCPIIALVRMV